MLPKFNINDLEGVGLAITERLMKLLSKFDIVIDESTMIDGKKQSKEAVLSNALNSITSSAKIFEFRNAFEALDAEVIK